MSIQTSKEADNRISLYQQDGLQDIFIGLGILFAGLFLWTEMVWMAAIFIPVFLPTFQAARKRFLEPRIGILHPNSKQQAQNQKVLLYAALLLGILMLAGIGMFFVFDLQSGPVSDWIQQYFLLAIGMIFASVWTFAGAMLKLQRFYLYAVFTLIALAAAQFTALPFWLALATLGGMVAFVGLLVLIRFVQQHPIRE